MNFAEKKTSKISPDHVSEWLELAYRDKAADGWRITANTEVCFQALEAWSNHRLNQNEIKKVLTEMHDKGVSSFDEFEAAVQQYSNQVPSKATREWLFIVPFQIEFEPSLSPVLQLCGHTFSFWNRDQVVAKIGKPKEKPYDLRLDTITHKKPYQSYIVSNFRGDTLNEAWHYVSKPFDALLGLLELNSNCGNQRTGWGVGGNAHTNFPRPKWLICFSEDFGPTLRWFLTEYGDYEEKPTKPVSPRSYESLLKNAALLAAPPTENSIHYLLMAGLVLYAQALDGRQPHSRLLGLWQLAEMLTLSDRFGGKTEIVCNRLVAFESLFDFNRSATRVALQNIAKKRNDFVHRGIRHHVEDRHVNLLKLTTESLLIQLSAIADKIKTINALEYYYQLHAKNDADIAALRQAVKLLRSTKRAPKVPKDTA